MKQYQNCQNTVDDTLSTIQEKYIREKKKLEDENRVFKHSLQKGEEVIKSQQVEIEKLLAE